MIVPFSAVVQLRNPTVLQPKSVSDVPRRAYFTNVSREGCKVAAVVTTRLEDDVLAHGTTVRVVGTAHNVLDTLYVEADSITPACDDDGMDADVPDIAAPARCRTTLHPEDEHSQAIVPVIGGPWSMTRDDKEQAFKRRLNHLTLIDITTSRAQGAPPVICVRTAIDSTAAAGAFLSRSSTDPVKVHFLGTVADVRQDCVVADLSEIRLVNPSGEFVVWDSRGSTFEAKSGPRAFLAFLASVFLRSSAKLRGSEGVMEIYATGIFYSQKKGDKL